MSENGQLTVEVEFSSSSEGPPDVSGQQQTVAPLPPGTLEMISQPATDQTEPEVESQAEQPTAPVPKTDVICGGESSAAKTMRDIVIIPPPGTEGELPSQDQEIPPLEAADLVLDADNSSASARVAAVTNSDDVSPSGGTACVPTKTSPRSEKPPKSPKLRFGASNTSIVTPTGAPLLLRSPPNGHPQPPPTGPPSLHHQQHQYQQHQYQQQQVMYMVPDPQSNSWVRMVPSPQLQPNHQEQHLPPQQLPPSLQHQLQPMFIQQQSHHPPSLHQQPQPRQHQQVPLEPDNLFIGKWMQGLPTTPPSMADQRAIGVSVPARETGTATTVNSGSVESSPRSQNNSWLVSPRPGPRQANAMQVGGQRGNGSFPHPAVSSVQQHPGGAVNNTSTPHNSSGNLMNASTSKGSIPGTLNLPSSMAILPSSGRASTALPLGPSGAIIDPNGRKTIGGKFPMTPSSSLELEEFGDGVPQAMPEILPAFCSDTGHGHSGQTSSSEDSPPHSGVLVKDHAVSRGSELALSNSGGRPPRYLTSGGHSPSGHRSNPGSPTVSAPTREGSAHAASYSFPGVSAATGATHMMMGMGINPADGLPLESPSQAIPLDEVDMNRDVQDVDDVDGSIVGTGLQHSVGTPSHTQSSGMKQCREKVRRVPFGCWVVLMMSMPLLMLPYVAFRSLHEARSDLVELEAMRPIIESASLCQHSLLLERSMWMIALAERERSGVNPTIHFQTTTIQDDSPGLGWSMTVANISFNPRDIRGEVNSACGSDTLIFHMKNSENARLSELAASLSKQMNLLQLMRERIFMGDRPSLATLHMVEYFFSHKLLALLERVRLFATTHAGPKEAVTSLIEFQALEDARNQLATCQYMAVVRHICFDERPSSDYELGSTSTSANSTREGKRAGEDRLRFNLDNHRALFRKFKQLLIDLHADRADDSICPFTDELNEVMAVELLDSWQITNSSMTRAGAVNWFSVLGAALTVPVFPDRGERALKVTIVRYSILAALGLVLAVVCTLIVIRVQILTIRHTDLKIIHHRRLIAAYAKFVPTPFLRLTETSIMEVGPGQQTPLAVSMLYSDILNFTSASLGMSSEALFIWLDGYMRRISQLAESCDGFVEKAIGDTVYCIFRHPADAARCAIEMQKETEVMNVKADFTGGNSSSQSNATLTLNATPLKPMNKRGVNHEADTSRSRGGPLSPLVAEASENETNEEDDDARFEWLEADAAAVAHTIAGRYGRADAKKKNSNIRLLRTAVGIHHAVVSAGFMGDQRRLQAVVISPDVNLASRVQELSPYYGARILLTDAAAQLLDRTRFGMRKLGPVQLAGGTLTPPFVLWELYQSDPHDMQDFKHHHRDNFEHAMDLRVAGDKAGSQRLLTTIKERGVARGLKDKTLLIKLALLSDPSDRGIDIFNN